MKGFEPVGFVDDAPLKKGRAFDGMKVLGSGEDLPAILKKQARGGAVVLAIGDAYVRENIFQRLEARKIPVTGFCHPKALVSELAMLHPTAMVWPGAIIHRGAKIGEGAMVNTGAIVEHDVAVGAFSHLAPGSILCGEAKIGQRTWIGAGAVVIQGLSVGDDVMLGAGSVVTRPIPNASKAFGVPAKIKHAIDVRRARKFSPPVDA